MRQVLIYIQFGPKGDRLVCPALPVKIGGRPKNVWTLAWHTTESAPPELPFRPVHGRNALHEDYVHDWDFNARTGEFRYFSRFTDEPVWVLLEYDA